MKAWHEYRRTGYPELTIGQGILNDGENANAAVQNMGGTNDMKTPVWWSKQAIDD